MAVQPPYSPNVVNQTVSYGGATWKGDPGTGWHLASTDARDPSSGMSGGGGAGGIEDIVKSAKELNTWQAEQNKPVIASMEAQRGPLIDRYSALLNEIKGNQSTAEKRQEVTTSNELGRRGISAESGLFGQTVTDKLNPITQQYTNLYKETSAGREADLMSLAQQIAQLQAGNPASAVSQALQFGSYQQNAKSIAQQIAASQAEQARSQQQLALEQAKFDWQKSQAGNDPLGIFG